MACVRACLFLAFALALGALAPAAAQDAQTPHLSPDVRTLYAHVKPDGEANFMNTLVADGLDEVSGPSGPVEGYGALANGAYTWTLPLEPALQRAVALDTAGTVEIHAYIGVGTGTGRVSVTTRLAAGDAAVLEGAAKDLVLAPANYPASHPYDRLTWTGKPATALLDPGQPLVWTVTVTGTASNVYLGSTELRGRSNVVLPVLSVAPAAVMAEGRPAHRSFATPVLDNATAFTDSTGLVQLDWTAAPSHALLNVTVRRASGQISLTVKDGGNRTLATERFAANSTRLLDLAGQEGTWRIELDAAAFTGRVALHAAPAQAAGASLAASAAASATGGTDAASGESTSAGKGAAALPPALLAAVLAGAAFAVRRRAKA